MAATVQAVPPPEPRERPELKAKADQKIVAIGLAAPIHGYLERLAALHDEAAETALLANLLGRTPWAASALGVAGILAVMVSLKAMPSTAIAIWLALMTISISATALVYGRAIAAPFDRDSLKTFARNLSAILVFTGAAWGSGVELALPGSVGAAGVVLFAVATSAALAAIFRTRDITNCFIVPATATATFGAFTRGFGGAATIGILLGGCALVLAGALLERFYTPQPETEKA